MISNFEFFCIILFIAFCLALGFLSNQIMAKKNKLKSNLPMDIKDGDLLKKINELIEEFNFDGGGFLDGGDLKKSLEFHKILSPSKYNEGIYVGHVKTVVRAAYMRYVDQSRSFIFCESVDFIQNHPEGYFLSQSSTVNHSNFDSAIKDSTSFNKLTEFSGLYFRAGNKLLIVLNETNLNDKTPELIKYLSS